MKRPVLLALCAAALCFGTPAHAAYPERPIKLVVPFPAGGTTDVLARAIAKSMSTSLGQPVVIDNRAGASTVIGTEAVARSPNDGYTVLLATATAFSINPVMNKKLPYSLDDFDTVGFIAEAPIALVTSQNVKATTLKELVAGLKQTSGEVTVATTGRGAFSHLTAAMFFHAVGKPFRDVPYRGEAPALQDLIGGQVDYYFGSLPGTLPHVSLGRIKAFAVTANERSPAAPSVPTFPEQGLDVVALSWFGLMTPKGTPGPVKERIASALVVALKDADVQARFAVDGATSRTLAPADFVEYIRRDSARWAKLMSAVTVRLND
jgi:tripartite-type tricarboxylate transporter receptor subunit TctC